LREYSKTSIDVNRSKLKRIEAFDGQLQKVKPYDLGLQVSLGPNSKIQKKDCLWEFQTISWLKIDQLELF